MKKIIKKIYQIIPFKKEIFIGLRKVWKPSQSIYQHLHFKGIINVKVNEKAGFKAKHYGYPVENDIFWSGLTGIWEKHSISLWIKLASQSKVIFDVGANTGVYSLIAKALNKDAEVYAFEPVKRVYSKLVYNNTLNNFGITCIEKAASNKNGFADIFDVDEEHEYSASLNENSGLLASQKATKVETITLDSFIKDNNISRLDLIKIDVETFEPEVLEGFSASLYRLRPTILIEVLSDKVGKKISGLIAGLGYIYFSIDEEKGPKRVDSIAKGPGMNFLICTENIAKNLELI